MLPKRQNGGYLMDTILQCQGYLPEMTLIHNVFIENHMLSANGSYVKVYLYLSKCIQAGEKDLSISTLADKMDNTEKDILRALHYWEKHSLIHLYKDEESKDITGIEMLNPEAPVTQPSHDTPARTKKKTEPARTSNAITSAKPAETKKAADRKNTTGAGNTDKTNTQNSTGGFADATDTDGIQDTSGEDTTGIQDTSSGNNTASITDNIQNTDTDKQDAVTTIQGKDNTPKNTRCASDIKITPEQKERLSADEEFVWTTRVIESYINKPLSPSDVQTISYLYDNLGFSPDLLLYLYEYCISIGKTHIKYIQSVAFKWDEENIKTPEQAKSFSSAYNATYTAISKALGLGRQLATAEKELADCWLNKWHMDLSVVLDACGRTILNIKKPDFKYTNTTIESWYKKNIHTLQEVQKDDEEYARTHPVQKNKSQHQGTYKPRNTNQFTNFEQREVTDEELDELERKLLAH